jgi:hypothetical protein
VKPFRIGDLLGVTEVGKRNDHPCIVSHDRHSPALSDAVEIEIGLKKGTGGGHVFRKTAGDIDSIEKRSDTGAGLDVTLAGLLSLLGAALYLAYTVASRF